LKSVVTKSAMVWSLLAALASAQAVGGQLPSTGEQGNLNTVPKTLEKVGIDQKLGSALPLTARFRDESGQAVELDQYFHHKRPVLLALVYYDCPMLCNQVLNGMFSALGVLKFGAGQEFDVLAVSFDPRETPEMAAAKKSSYLKRYKRESAERGVHFLTGGDISIKALTEAVGFRYTWDEAGKQFAHGSALILVTPQGRVAQYYYGIEYAPRDMRLGIIEASEEKIGNVVDQVLLYCFHYDPMTGKYGAVAMRVMRIAGVLTVLLLAGYMILNFRRDAHARAA
jgi:protein SCO1/2